MGHVYVDFNQQIHNFVYTCKIGYLFRKLHWYYHINSRIPSKPITKNNYSKLIFCFEKKKKPRINLYRMKQKHSENDGNLAIIESQIQYHSTMSFCDEMSLRFVRCSTQMVTYLYFGPWRHRTLIWCQLITSFHPD